MARVLDAVSGSAESGSTSAQCVEGHIPQPYKAGFEHAPILLSLDCFSLDCFQLARVLLSLGTAFPGKEPREISPKGCSAFPRLLSGGSSQAKAVNSSKLKAV